MKASMNDVWGLITVDILDTDFKEDVPAHKRLYAITFEQDKDDITLYIHGRDNVMGLTKELRVIAESLERASEKQA